jgi:hypothetical protein
LTGSDALIRSAYEMHQEQRNAEYKPDAVERLRMSERRSEAAERLRQIEAEF